MYSDKERVLIERCLSVSILNYRAGKFILQDNEKEALVFGEKVKRELLILKELLERYSPENERGRDAGNFRGFFQRLFGRG